MTALLLALTSNIFFASASVYFTKYSKIFSPEWMNLAKALIAAIGFGIICFIGGQWVRPTDTSILLFVISGGIGLWIGDIFLLRAFTHLGSGRTLMVFGFQPLILGMVALVVLGQEFPLIRLTAVLFLILCLLSFSMESYKTKGHWDIKGISFALIGIILDAGGVFLTRYGFELSPNTTPFTANFIRASTAASGFILMGLFWPSFKVLEPLRTGKRSDLVGVAIASIFGTFLSLSFYLMAIKVGHLASISAIACTSPLFATLIETLRGHRPMTKYLALGTSFFLIGFSLLALT